MIKATRRLSLMVMTVLAFALFTLGILAVRPAVATPVVDTNKEIITIDNGAEVRLDNTGLRFTIRVNKSNYSALTATGENYEGYEPELGAAIIPSVVLDGKELDASVASYEYDGKTFGVLSIPLTNKLETETEYIYKAVVTSIPDLNYETELTARAYIKLTKDETTEYIQSADVAKKSIGEVVTAFYTDTEEPPTDEEKEQLQSLIDNKVIKSLATTLDNGYLSDFSSSSYAGLVRHYVDNYNLILAPKAEVVDPAQEGLGDIEETSVLKVTLTGGYNGHAGFILKLPKDPGANKYVTVKMYNKCSVGQGLWFQKPGSTSRGGENDILTSDIANATQNKWTVQTLDYSGLDKTDEILLYTFGGNEGAQAITIYLAYVKALTVEDGYIADFSSDLYENLVSPLGTTWYSPTAVAEYMPEYDGEKDVLKIVSTAQGGYTNFKLKLPKAINSDKIYVRMYAQITSSAGMKFTDPATVITHSDEDGGVQCLQKNVWYNYEVDYSSYTVKDVLEVCVWSGDTQVTFYLDWIKEGELTAPVAPEDGNVVADFDSYDYINAVSKYSYGTVGAQYMDNFAGETGVLKLTMTVGSDTKTGFVIKLPTDPGRNKIQVKMYFACEKGIGYQFMKPGTTTKLAGDFSTRGEWKVFDLDYTTLDEGSITDELRVYAWGTNGYPITVYLSYIIFAE